MDGDSNYIQWLLSLSQICMCFGRTKREKRVKERKMFVVFFDCLIDV